MDISRILQSFNDAKADSLAKCGGFFLLFI